MERVTGIGGFFFRAKDPDALALWYQERLGVDPVPKTYEGTVWRRREGATVFAPSRMTRRWSAHPERSATRKATALRSGSRRRPFSA